MKDQIKKKKIKEKTSSLPIIYHEMDEKQCDKGDVLVVIGEVRVLPVGLDNFLEPTETRQNRSRSHLSGRVQADTRVFG